MRKGVMLDFTGGKSDGRQPSTKRRILLLARTLALHHVSTVRFFFAIPKNAKRTLFLLCWRAYTETNPRIDKESFCTAGMELFRHSSRRDHLDVPSPPFSRRSLRNHFVRKQMEHNSEMAIPRGIWGL